MPDVRGGGAVAVFGGAVVVTDVGLASADTGTLSPQFGHGVRWAAGISAIANTDRQNGHVTETDMQ